MLLNTTKDFHQLTQQVGLTLNESKVYLFLSTSGLNTGSEIFQGLNLDKSSTYRAINSLIKKNLVYSIGEERNQQFGANSSDTIFSLIDHKQKELDETKHQLKTITQELTQYTRDKYKQDHITVFQGIEGFKQWNNTRLEYSDTVIRELSQREALILFFESEYQYEKYMRAYIKKRISNNISIRVLCGKNSAEDEFDVTSKKLLKEVRTIKTNFDADATLSTWRNKTGFISFNQGSPLAIIIKDKFITSIINTLYDTLWNVSKTRYKEKRKL